RRPSPDGSGGTTRLIQRVFGASEWHPMIADKEYDRVVCQSIGLKCLECYAHAPVQRANSPLKGGNIGARVKGICDPGRYRHTKAIIGVSAAFPKGTMRLGAACLDVERGVVMSLSDECCECITDRLGSVIDGRQPPQWQALDR